MNNYCLYSVGPMSGNFEQTIRVVHEGLPHFYTHPELQFCENFANNGQPFYLCILENTLIFRPPFERSQYLASPLRGKRIESRTMGFFRHAGKATKRITIFACYPRDCRTARANDFEGLRSTLGQSAKTEPSQAHGLPGSSCLAALPARRGGISPSL